MRTMLVLLTLAMVASVVTAEDEKVEKERKKLTGTWVLSSGEVDGKAIADEHVKQSKMTIEAGGLTLKAPHQAKEPIKAKITRLDPSGKLAEMDWVRDSGPGTGKTMMAIYEWVDEDSYRICFDPSGKGRPKELKAATGSGHIFHVWKRSK